MSLYRLCAFAAWSLFQLIAFPGLVPAFFLGRIKQYGDGTGNETGYIEFLTWSFGFGLVMWSVAIGGIVYYLS